MTILIRKMDERDLQRCSEINYYAWTVDFKEFETIVPPQIQTVPAHALVATTNNGLVVGYISWYYDDHGAFIHMLYIDTNYRKQGVGSRLLDALIHTKEANQIRLYSHIANHDALIFYKKRGFNIIKELIFKEMPVYEMVFVNYD